MFHQGNWWSYIQYDEEQDRPTVDRSPAPRSIRPSLPLFSCGGDRHHRRDHSHFAPAASPHARSARHRDSCRRSGASDAARHRDGGGAARQRRRRRHPALGVIKGRRGDDLRSPHRRLRANLQRMSLGFFTSTRPGELMSRLNNDVVGAQSAVTGTIVSVASNGLAVVATIAVMLSLEWRLTLVAVAILPLFIWPSRRAGRALRRVTRDQMQANARMNSAMNETLNLSGALLVKLFGRTGDEDRRFANHAASVRDLGVRRALIGRWFFMALGVVSALGTALVFWLGAVLVIRGDLTIGTIVAPLRIPRWSLRAAFGPVQHQGGTRHLARFVRAGVRSARPSRDVAEPDDAVHLDEVAGRGRSNIVSFDYRAAVPSGLEHVERFSWRSPSGEDVGPVVPIAGRGKAIDDLDFDVQPGSLIALVGPSGAGKTTVTYLIPRLYDATEGRVLIDGHDVRTLSFETIARSVGVVTQENYLFHDTIAATCDTPDPSCHTG